MKISKSLLTLAAACVLTISLYSCKAKKAVVKPPPPVATVPAAAPAPAPVEEKKEEPVAAPAPKPDFDFSNVQFEFNSSVLKTASYPILDNVALEMKKDPAAKFVINGHSSAEGTPEHNLSLSVDRANSVKSYLVNAGLPDSNFSIKGFGEKVPVAPNDTESGRQLNRRVEIKKN